MALDLSERETCNRGFKMTDYNSMKADEFAQRQGEMDELDNQVEVVAEELFNSLPEWVNSTYLASTQNYIMAMSEAKRRVTQAIKERSEP